MRGSSNKTEPAGSTSARLSSVLDTPAVATGAGGDGKADAAAMMRVGVLVVLFVFLHWRMLDWLVRSWLKNPNWSHGFLIPLFSLYLIYTRRNSLRQVKRRVCLPGLVLMILCLLGEVVVGGGIPGVRSFWLMAFAMVGMMLSLVLYLAGPAMLRMLWLPIAFLLLAVPVTESLYVRAAYPLQEFAAAGAVGVLNMIGVEITRKASNLSLLTQAGQVHDLTVAEACSGMRLLMAFFALGVATAYLETRPIWQRIVLVAAALPIAVLCNVLRVTITCTMYYIDKPELGQGVLHNFAGMLMLIPAFGMLWVLGWVLNRLFVDVEEEDDDQAEMTPSAGPVGAEGQGR